MIPIVILAGGLANRMRPHTETMPKALLVVAGEPFINHQLRLLKRNGISEVILCIGYLGEQIQALIGDGREFGMRVSYSSDWPDLLGTGGAVAQVLPQINSETFMVLYGDSYLDIDYGAVVKSFSDSGKQALMTVYKNDGQYDASNVIFEDGQIVLYDKVAYVPQMQYIDYGLGCFAKSSFQGCAPVFDLSSLYTDFSIKKELAGFEVFKRFFEIGSPAGLKDLDCLLGKHRTSPVIIMKREADA